MAQSNSSYWSEVQNQMGVLRETAHLNRDDRRSLARIRKQNTAIDNARIHKSKKRRK